MEKNIPSQHNERCTHCGEMLASWATEIGHCHICMQPLPVSDPSQPETPSASSRESVASPPDPTQSALSQHLPTAEEMLNPSVSHNQDSGDFNSTASDFNSAASDFNGAASDFNGAAGDLGNMTSDFDSAADDLDSEADDLPEDTMRYTKSNSRVLLQEDTLASSHLASSPVLDALDTTQEVMTQVSDSAHDPHQHLPTEEVHFDNLDDLTDDTHQQTTITTPFNNLEKTQLDILEDAPTMRILSSKEKQPDEAPSADQPDKPPSQFKQVKGILGQEKPPPPLSPYMLEEQHTLSQPLDVVAELRKRSDEPAPHLAASFALSQTLQDLSLKEVQELRPKPGGPKPNPMQTPPESPGGSELPRPEPAQDEGPAPSAARFPSWLLWFLGGLLWVGLGALLWNFVVAPGQEATQPPSEPTITRTTEPPQEAKQGAPTPEQTNLQTEQALPDTSPAEGTQETQEPPDIQEQPSIRKRPRPLRRRYRRRRKRKRKLRKSKRKPTKRPTKRSTKRTAPPAERPVE